MTQSSISGYAPYVTSGGQAQPTANQVQPDILANGTENENPLTGEYASSSASSVNPEYYAQAANTATQQAEAYYNQGKAAMNTAAPTITNAQGAQQRAALQQNQGQYNALNKNLATTANGGGINAGQAIQQQGMNTGIAAQLAAAQSGRGGQGGYNLGDALGAQAQGQAAGQQLTAQAAQARGSQINAAQGALGANLYSQGQTLGATNQTQYGAALAQAQLQQAQSQANQNQSLALFNQSGQEQSQYLNAVNDYDQQALAAQQAGNAQYQQTHQSDWQQFNEGLGATEGFVSGLESFAGAGKPSSGSTGSTGS